MYKLPSRPEVFYTKDQLHTLATRVVNAGIKCPVQAKDFLSYKLGQTSVSDKVLSLLMFQEGNVQINSEIFGD